MVYRAFNDRQALETSSGTSELSPPPTAAPGAYHVHLKRAKDTCGYYSGDSKSPITCADDGYTCSTNSRQSAIGCCSGASGCRLWTACLPSASTQAAAGAANGTLYCSQSAYPYCAVVAFGEPYLGLTIPVCDSIVTTYPAYASVTSTSSSASSTTTIPPPPSTSSTPVGAIVGGVVGGIAGLVAIGGLILFCLRRRKKKASAQPTVPSTSGTPGMADAHSGFYGTAYNYRSSIAKPSDSVPTGATSPVSPYYQSFSGAGSSVSPPPWYGAAYAGHQEQMYPPQQFQATQNFPQEMSVTHELPATRQDPGTQELPGSP